MSLLQFGVGCIIVQLSLAVWMLYGIRKNEEFQSYELDLQREILNRIAAGVEQ